MRKIILLLSLAVPCLASAQTIVSLGGGASVNTAPAFLSDTKPHVSPYYSLSLTQQLGPHLQAILSAGFTRIQVWKHNDIEDPSGWYPQNTITYIGKYAWPVTAGVSYTLRRHASQWVLGAQAGVLITGAADVAEQDQKFLMHGQSYSHAYYDNTVLFTGGLQLGYNYFIPGIPLVAGISIRPGVVAGKVTKDEALQTPPAQELTVFYMPAALSIGYRIR